MTYLQFHFVFILPWILFLLIWQRDLWRAKSREVFTGIGFVVLLALVYTTPWDNYLVAKGVWTYPPDRVLAVIGYVPVEEYLFFILQTVLTGLWTYYLHQRFPLDLNQPRSLRPRLGGAVVALALAVVGAVALFNERTLYLGLILAWALPVVALHWGWGGDWMARNWKVWVLGVGVPSVYLSLADAVAIDLGIWQISERYTMGVSLFGLPFEEALFFTIANILVVQGTYMYWLTFAHWRKAQPTSVPKHRDALTNLPIS